MIFTVAVDVLCMSHGDGLLWSKYRIQEHSKLLIEFQILFFAYYTIIS